MRVLTAAVVVVGIAACSTVAPRLHAGEIEQAIVSSVRTEFRGAVLGPAHCPANRKQQAGDVFTCTMTVDGTVAHFTVRQLDGHGKVDAPRLVEHVVAVHDVEGAVVDAVRTRELLDVTASCGPGVVILAGGPLTRRCAVTYDKGVVRHFDVALDAQTQVRAVQPVEALVSTFTVGSEISDRLSAERGHVVYVQCGDRQLVVAPGHVFGCRGADHLGAPLFPIKVTVTDATGKYTFTPSR